MRIPKRKELVYMVDYKKKLENQLREIDALIQISRGIMSKTCYNLVCFIETDENRLIIRGQ